MKKTLCILILMLLAAITVAGQVPYQFINLNTQNSGISYDSVNKITQDSRGFIWIGTAKGLNRYDGSSFKVYDRDELGLTSDYVFCIEEDHSGNIWVGTDNGVSCYDYEKDRFEPLKAVSDKGTVIHNKVTFITVDRDGTIWMLVNDQGVFNYAPATGTLKMYPYSSFGNHIIGFRKMLHASGGDFLMSCYHLNLFHSGPGFADFSPVGISEPDYFLNDEIEGIFESSDGRIYVTSTKHGISSFSIAKGDLKNNFQLPQDITLVDASIDSQDRIWLATTGGVWCYGIWDGSIEHIRWDRNDIFSISGDYVLCSFVDRDGGIWIGTKDGGVNYCGTNQSSFRRSDKAGDMSLKGAIVRSFAEDDMGHVWVSTEQCGLLRYDVDTGNLSHIDNPLIPKTTFSLCYESPYLWIGTFEGLFRMDVRTGAVKDYGILERKSGINDPRIDMMFKTRTGEFFVTTTLGIFRYDPGGDKFHEVEAFDGVFLTGVAEDADGCLWIATYATGMYKWDFRAGSLPVHYTSTSGCGLETDKISSVFIDSRNRVWVVGFSHGLAVYDPLTSKFSPVNRQTMPSLPSDVCFRMLEDDNGQLWVSTDSGLVQFDPETRDIKVYSKIDGLLDNKFTKSSLRSGSGDFYFGSDNGFVRFTPSDLYRIQNLPDVVITGFSIAGEEVYLGRNPDLLDEIALDKDRNSFSLAFSVLNVHQPASLRLQCSLDGYEDVWHDIMNSKSVSFYNVPAGSYDLRIRASSLNGEWIEIHAPVRIVVKPGFWASAPGIILILSFALIFIVSVFTLLEMRSRRIHREKVEAYRKAKDEEAFQDKMNFFSHVIHEIKTPLTLIKTPLANVLSKDAFDNEARHDLEVMKNSADYLATLVNELLDFVRVEKRGYTLHPERIDMVERLRSMVFDYNDTAKNSNIDMKFTTELQAAMVQADKSALDKILNNLLLNAVKYAETRIDINLSVEGSCVVLRISNDGNVIPENQREEVFKPFVQHNEDSRRSSSGVGIGLPLARNLARMHSGDLILSPEQGETCFILTLPVDESPDAVQDLEGEIRAGSDTERMKILVADDNPDLREYLSQKLSDIYDVVTVSNGNAAMSALREQNIDLIVTDISMPGKNGLEICREIRDDIEISHLPVIILSARASMESKIQAMESGADLYIEKPFDLEYLKTSIRNILDRRQLMRNAVSRGMASSDIDKFGLPRRDTEFFSKFDGLIRDNLSDTELNVEWLAENLGMSPSTLTRKIRKLINTTPNNYIRSVRLSIAAEMLKNSDGNNISDICYTVGFSNLSYFAKCFKGQYGKIPTEYAGKGQ